MIHTLFSLSFSDQSVQWHRIICNVVLQMAPSPEGDYVWNAVYGSIKIRNKSVSECDMASTISQMSTEPMGWQKSITKNKDIDNGRSTLNKALF